MREYDEETLDCACQTACNIVLRDTGESFDVDAVKSRVLHAWENPLRTVYAIAWTQDDVKRGPVYNVDYAACLATGEYDELMSFMRDISLFGGEI